MKKNTVKNIIEVTLITLIIGFMLYFALNTFINITSNKIEEKCPYGKITNLFYVETNNNDFELIQIPLDDYS